LLYKAKKIKDMENIETQEFIPELDYEASRQEIANLKAEEMAKKEKDPLNYNPHFDDINPDDLGTRALDIYKEYKDGTLSLEKFLEYQKSFQGIENIHDSNFNFMAYMANKTSTREWIKKWQPEIYKKHFEHRDKE